MTSLRTALVAALALAAAIPGLAAQAPSAHPDPRITSLLDSLNKVKPIGAVALAPRRGELAMVLGGTLTLQDIDQSAGAQPAGAQSPQVCSDETPAQIISLTWSPDGRHLGVLATCGESTSVYVLELPDGPGKIKPARRLVELHGFAKALEYAPDGRHLGLLYVEGASRPSGALAAMKPPSGVIGVEGLEIQRVATIDATTGQLQQVTPSALHVYEFAWSPDSRKLAFVAAPPPGENNWWVAKLYTETLGAEPRAILDPATVEGPLHGLQIAVPRWSPDSSEIAFIGGLMSDQGATGGDIYRIAAGQTSAPINLTPGQHASAVWLGSWRAGQLKYTAIKEGTSQLDTLLWDEKDRTPHPRSTVDFEVPASIGDGRLAMSLAESSDDFAFVKSSFSEAPEVWLAKSVGAECRQNCYQLKQVTHLNADQHPSWGKTESVTWTSDSLPGEPASLGDKAGSLDKVQGWLFYPGHYDPSRKYGLIVMVHGGPSSAVLPHWPGASFGAAPFSAAGYFVLEANPRGSYGEGEAFTAANRKDFGHGDLRDILAGVDAVEKQIPAIDDHRLGLTGWSYGGFMTMFGVTQTTRFHAAVAGAGIANWLSYYGENSIDQWMTPFFGATVYDDPAIYAKSSAIDYIKQAKTPTLVVVGDRDGECPAPQSFEFWHALKAQGVATQLVVYPNEGHGFVDPAHRRDVIERAIGWFDTYLQ